MEFFDDPDEELEVYEGMIDTKGKFRFSIPEEGWWNLDYGYGYFSEGLATVDIRLRPKDSIKVWSSRARNTYKGVINTGGELLFCDTAWEEITSFGNHRAFVRDTLDDWYLINQQGERLNEEPYLTIGTDANAYTAAPAFYEGIAFVESEAGWTAIDTNGVPVAGPKARDWEGMDLIRYGRNILVFEDEPLDEDWEDYAYGIWDIEADIWLDAQFQHIVPHPAKPLYCVYQNELMAYVNTQGEFVWKESTPLDQPLAALHIDYMNRGYFYAASPHVEALAGLGGWGESGNLFKRMTGLDGFAFDSLSIRVEASEEALFLGQYPGMKLFVANTRQDTSFFSAQDSRLFLKLQAKDQRGEWRDIEYLPNSWCGNSYHTLISPPQALLGI